ncbi:hypothetical protein OQI_39665, partial [Streptomyces pharetrae CZA14]
SALTRVPEITQSVVLVKEHQAQDGPARQLLVAYYVSPAPLDAQHLSERLAAGLPAYMIPETFVHLPELPLSPNGKLDRGALPDPAPAVEEVVPPRGERERRLRDLWADVLGMPAERLGITMDLMRLGMDSIVAIRLVSRIRREFGVRAGVRDVFEHRTVERFHDRV